MGKAMPRKVRKSVTEHVRALRDGREIDAWAQAVHRAASRAGLLVAGDLGAALAAVLGAAPDRELVLESPDAHDLLTFWLSPDALALRQRLGLST
ncbi:MAG: hypothetical protein M5U28_10620 [Sandaracinaceae bacterium]|nr:hypothetical protein [Sandaracinaceae bacterium]